MESFKSKHSPLELIDDVLLGASHTNTEELICCCRDGQVGFSKFYLGLLSPVLFRVLNNDVYSALGQVMLLLPDFSVSELEELRSLPRESATLLQGRQSALLQTLAVLERFRRSGDKSSPRPSPHISPFSRKVAVSTAAKPLSNCCEYIPDIYSIELFEPDCYLEDFEIQNEENLSLTIHSSKDQHGPGHAAKKSKRVRLLSRKSKTNGKVTATEQSKENDGACKILIKVPKKYRKHSKPVKVKSGDGIAPFECDQCSDLFATDSELHAHAPCRQQLVPAGSRKFACQSCGKSFKKSFQLENHLRIHSGDRPFVCHTCGKAFNQEATLRTHMRIHSGSKPHACKECGESFVTAFALVSHLQWKHNEGIRPFLCSFCSKAFPTKQALSKHETIHRMEKKYSCHQCEKKFSRPDHLKSHMRTHPNVLACLEGESAA